MRDLGINPIDTRSSVMAGTRSATAKAAADIEDARHVAAPMAHVLLVCLQACCALVTVIEPNLHILATATLAVYAGAHRSIKPAAQGNTEAMTKQDAMRFPVIGSCVLFGFFVLFKYLPKDLVNKLLTVYFVVLGIFALVGCLSPVLARFVPKSFAGRVMKFGTLPTIPLITDGPTKLECTPPELIAGVAACGFCGWYVMEKHWVANNALGLAFSLTGVEFLTLDSVQIGTILLVGLFFYDIFWVFFTPVMVTVAKSFDAPIKLLFPRVVEPGSKSPFSMLGLGDIVVPGIYVALTLRMDLQRAAQAKAEGKPAPKRYFPAVIFGYFAGLATTIVVMNVFNAAQPALLYIVPGILGATFLRALVAGGVKELKEIWAFVEAGEEEGADEPKKSK